MHSNRTNRTPVGSGKNGLQNIRKSNNEKYKRSYPVMYHLQIQIPKPLKNQSQEKATAALPKEGHSSSRRLKVEDPSMPTFYWIFVA